MSLELFIYTANVLPRVGHAIGFIGGGCIILSGIFGLATYLTIFSDFDDKEEDGRNCRKLVVKYFAVSLIIGLTLLIPSLFIPSEKTLYLMAGTDLATQSGVPQKVVKIINDKLDEFAADPRGQTQKVIKAVKEANQDVNDDSTKDE